MIVTIDGPAGAGKSTLARALAKRLRFQFLDTGAMYRAVALSVLQSRIDPQDEQTLARRLSEIELTFQDSATVLNGVDVSQAIRTPEVTNYVRHVADKRAVREFLTGLQRRSVKDCDVVTEGRDQGTVVFPDAQCKFFLTASPEARARRRQRDFIEQGVETDFEQVLADQIERDRRDQERELSPLRPASDAHHVDTSELSVEEVLALLEEVVQRSSQQRVAHSE